MKNFLLIIVFLGITQSIFSEQIVTDMAGRSVTLPDSKNIERIFTANPISSIFLYTVEPSLMIGWNTNLSKEAQAELRKDVVDLKNYGVIYGNGKSANDEEIIKSAPNFILLMGEETPSIGIKADEIYSRLNIPVLVLYSDLKSTYEAYSIIGKICGLEQRTKSLGLFTENVITRAEKITKTISNKKKVYYSLDSSGLKTYPKGSLNTSLIELCGGTNVITLPNNKKFGTMTISFEELLLNKPEIILAGSYPNREMRDGTLFDDSHWNLLEADISIIPRNPFNIFDKPPSVNRVAGIIWLQAELYPDIVNYDKEKELMDFRALFYGIN